MKRFLVSLLVLAAVAHARSITIEDIAADIAVAADGSITVTETLKLAFEGSWNGIYRLVPYRYRYPNGLRDTLHLEVESITDAAGADLWNEISHEGDNLKLKIAVPGAHDATRTVVIRYRSRNTIRPYGDAEGYDAHDELYWNVTGTGWPFPIRHASATVTLPLGVPVDEVRTTAFTGALGSTESEYETTRLEDGRIRFSAKRVLSPYEGLTIVVGFPPGHVTYPTAIEKAWWLFQANWGALAPLLVALFWLAAWWFRGRDPIANATIIPEFEAPFGLRPSQVGVIADEMVQARDVSACIIDLAVRGHYTIDARKSEVSFRKKDPPSDGPPLLPFEKEVLDGLFKGGAKTGSAKQNRLGKRMGKIREAIYEDVTKGGYFLAQPDHVWTVWGCGGAVALVVSAVIGFIWATWWVTALALIPATYVVVKCTRFMPKRSRQGLEALRRVRGMEDYLETAEKERLKNMPRSHFEELLPYAVALGVQDRWTEVFQEFYREPPAWFIGREGDDFNTGTRRFVRSTNDATNYTPPRSSSSGGSWSGGSGFSGGGSSGGGFGGGGGGGW